jgi:hypothetical protein
VFVHEQRLRKHADRAREGKASRKESITGLLMTATSASVVFDAMIRDRKIITHVPDPKGLPGGYPVHVNARDVEVVLPSGLSLERARQINEAGLRLDSIQRIASDGTVFFTEEVVSVVQETLGYRWTCLPLAEVDKWAEELDTKYLALEKK